MLTRNITTCTPLLDIFGFGNLVFVGSVVYIYSVYGNFAVGIGEGKKR